MKFRPKIEKIIKKNKKMSSPHNFGDFDDENHDTWYMYKMSIRTADLQYFVPQ